MKAVRTIAAKLIPLASILLLALPLSPALGGENPSGSADSKGKPSQVTPQSLDLSAYKGKVVYLEFWASWCGPCRMAFPWMNTMQEKYGPKGFVVVTVNLDRKKADAEKFLKEIPASFEVRYDPEGKYAAMYGLKAMPSSFIYDRGGKLRESHVGFRKDEAAKVEKSIEALLAEEAPDGSVK